MAKKVLFVSLILFGLVFFVIVVRCFADATADLEQADAYKNSGNYEQAEVAYKAIVIDYPGTDGAMQAQSSLARLYIDLGDLNDANAAVDKLITDFSDNNGVGGAVFEVAYHYRRSQEYDRAIEWYQYVLDNHSESEAAMRSQAGLAILNIDLGDMNDANAAIDKLIADFSDVTGIAKTVDYVADTYHKVKDYEKAIELYQHIVDNWPEDEYAIWSQLGVAVLNFSLGDANAAEAAVDKLLADFSDDEHGNVCRCER